MIDKKSLTETDIRTKFITPSIVKADWDCLTQIREEYKVTNGRIIARGKTCKHEAPLKADYTESGKRRGKIQITDDSAEGLYCKQNKYTSSSEPTRRPEYEKDTLCHFFDSFTFCVLQ